MEEDEDMDKTPRAKLSSPELVPWLPPGKPKDSTFNVYAHKKNEGVYDLGESKNSGPGFWPSNHKTSLNFKSWKPKLPKRSIQGYNSRKNTLDITKQRRIDSLLNADHNTDAEKEYLRKRILEIFQDSEEGKKVLGELDKEDEEEEKNKERQRKKGRRNSDPSSKDDGKKKKKKGRSRSYDGDTDSQPYSAKSEPTPTRRNNDEGYDSESENGKNGKNKNSRKNKKIGSANTDTSGLGTDDDIDDRNSIEFIDFDSQTDVSPRRQNNRNGGNNNGNNNGNGFDNGGNGGNGQNFNGQFPGQGLPGQFNNGPAFPGGPQFQNGQFPGQPFTNTYGQSFQSHTFADGQQYPGQFLGPNGPGFPGQYNGQAYLGTNGYLENAYQGLNYINQGPQLNSFEDQQRHLRAKSQQTINYQGKHSQTDGFYDSGDDFFLSPTPVGFQSIQLDRSRQSRVSQRGPGPNEAWVIFPKNGESPRRGDQGNQTFTARPVNLASSIGSRLKQSFAQINRSSTPIEQTTSSRSSDPLIVDELSEAEKLERKNNKKRNALIAGGAACCAIIILASILILALIFATGNSSDANLQAPDFYQGIGNSNDSTPCLKYTPLTERWRRIVGYGPLNSGGQYYCDLPRYAQSQAGIREGWHRFMGEAGTHLATTSPGAYAPGAGTLKEVCGTSYVGWMNGEHPKIHEGIVMRNFCFEYESGTCQYGFNSYVRTCPDPNGGPSGTFYVYFLKIPRDIQCNFGFCAEA